ncbi:MAG: hypothetical protein AB1704_34325 [Pseudomonadota bacterium]|uniref:hypothetical protein n=1 Tax=Burkholderiaceae TaxID=119060 RepID=UPI0010F63E9D|nr:MULTISPECIES: hypothetical protein [Burkholderiaceae]
MQIEPGMTFAEWTVEAEADARRVLDRTTGDVTWLLGSSDDMRQVFNEGYSPADYVQSQLARIVE